MLKKIAKIGILLTVKETYLLIKNSFGLGVHPYKTLKALQREKDRSQQLLLLGWPVYLLSIGLICVWFGRRLLGSGEEWGLPAKTALWLVGLGTISLGGYLGYWLLRIKKSEGYE